MQNVYKMEVKAAGANGSKKKVVVGEVAVPYPTLADFGIDAQPTGEAKDGTPIYATDELNWLFAAVFERTKSNARNKLQTGSVELKTGAAIPATLGDLCKPAENTGEGLKAANACKAAFGEYVAKQGIGEQGQKFLRGHFGSPAGIATLPAEIRGKITERVEGFAEEYLAGPDANGYAEAYITKVLEAAASEEELTVDII